MGGNGCQLTEHKPRWTDTHETVQPFPDTVQKHNKAQADTETGARAAEPDPQEGKSEGGPRGGVTWAPDLAETPLSESGSVSEPLTDQILAAHFEQITVQVQDQINEGQKACKFSVAVSTNQEGSNSRGEKAGEHF